MQVIPVLDLKDRVVVRARMGQRDLYRPIETPLSATSDPVDVARGLLSLHPFETLYIADLDAIEGDGGNERAIARLRAAFPSVTLWVDNGISDLDRAREWLAAGSGRLVLGSETQTDVNMVRQLAADDRVVLSLDFRGAAFAGPRQLLTDPACWPERLIVMTLARVGSRIGPELDRLAQIKAVAAGRSVYAAGGVRNASDLAALQSLGLAGALIATSLHDGSLTPAELANL
jgi:phosphoribosylformimino-5-aminoimidazole carboxamide ribotide isomerase